ncbi:MAG: peptidylprolyl isomerase FKBP-type [Mycobacterium sp.]|nr:peptidylprolyl isomerase FKBP-type [Mycobacterium sp.]
MPNRRLRAAVATAGVLILALSACSSGSSPTNKVSASSSASGSAAGAPSAPAAGALFPTVSGSFGTKPTLAFPKTKPSPDLQVKVLSTGKGPTVVKNNLIVVNYLGQIWQGKAFDNSFDAKAPLGTPIGAGKVIKGWDEALVGKKVGSRVLMVVPPSLGYGSAGQSAAGIKGTDSLAFVVDIVAQYSKTDIGDTKAVVQKVSTAPVTVTGALGARPKVSVAKGAKAPTAPKTTVLAKSTGAKVTAGTVVLQYEAVDYTGTVVESTFANGQPQSTQVAAASSGGNAFDGIIGVPIGSRVLIVTQVQSSTGTATPIAIVVDIVAELPPT